MTDPSAPDSLPKYMVEGVPKQSDETLRDLQNWIDQILDYRANISEEDIEADEGEQIEDVKKTSSGTVVIKRVSCGKDSCSNCPNPGHGPYKYIVKRQDGKLNWDYKGPVQG